MLAALALSSPRRYAMLGGKNDFLIRLGAEGARYARPLLASPLRYARRW
ncbi:hypothetical protein [Rothia nasisuis]|nr:hypothetical protein [Rothia nasisuis]